MKAYEKEIRLLGGLASVSKTDESFRMALEREINRWSGFARALRKPDLEAFDELMDMCRSYASESSYATKPIIFEPMVVSIILAQSRRMAKIQEALNAIQPSSSISPVDKKENSESQPGFAIYFKKKKPGGDQTRLF